MEHAEKLALATQVLALTMRPFAETLPRDKPLPPAKSLERMNEMQNRRRALLAELYAERLSAEQLQALAAHHGSALMRSVAAEMPAIHAEAHKRLTELWGDGSGKPNVGPAHNRSSAGTLARIVAAAPALDSAQQSAVQRLIEEERLIEATHAQLVRNLLKALEAGATGTDLARFYTRDAEQVEQPNRLNPNGGRSDLATLLVRAEKGKQLLARQAYELTSIVAEGACVAAEVRWTGTLAVALGTLAAGAELRAHIAMFFDMKDGLIHRQRNYDCFEAW